MHDVEDVRPRPPERGFDIVVRRDRLSVSASELGNDRSREGRLKTRFEVIELHTPRPDGTRSSAASRSPASDILTNLPFSILQLIQLGI